MKWSKMNARERDSLVAEKIMGWTQVSYDDDVMCEDWFGFENGKEDDQNAYWPVPHYTTDISAAWEVAKQMISFEISKSTYMDTGVVEYHAIMSKDRLGGAARQTSLPEAICLGALRAIGMKIDESLQTHEVSDIHRECVGG